ncbi:hypothetical protein [Saccharomonospora piscinae]|uniref:hypothetical protein n=1 Tax=Saccharomonospora piscinae TaxID=687388 RepID=UPI0004679037|nr:hypothetical protein [Saccharomonospora piscinae]
MSTYKEELRRDRAAKAEQARADRLAEAEQRRHDRELEAEQRRKDQAAAAADARRDQREREARKQDRKQKRKAALTAVLATVGENRVAVAIYGIALVSFVMSAPAMADYGHRIYAGSAWPFTGWLLPVVTELSMWACAFAVHHRRRTAPGTSVLWLLVGVGLSTALAAALNAMKGLTVGWDASVVMGVVSIAGVLLHQMTVAGHPRTRGDREAARIARQVARKEKAARQAAIADAAVEITDDGTARLVFEPGVYRIGRDRDPRLRPEVPPLDRPGPRDVLDDEIAALLDAEATRTDHDDASGGGVATLDRPGGETGPETGGDGKKPGETPKRRGGRRARPMGELRADLAALIQAHPEAVSWSGSRLARELGCDKRRALSLRNELNQSKGEQ